MVSSRREENFVSAPKKEEILALVKENWATSAGSVGSGKSDNSQFVEHQPDMSPHFASIPYYFVTRS